ncbi:MAG: CHAD domain-containing protein [Phycisphaerales bacterium JB037]
MPYRFRSHDRSTAHAVRRIAREQLARAIREIDDPSLPVDDKVHQVRKRCKKVRALLRLVRGSLADSSPENRFLRDTARLLAPLRDADVRAATYDKLLDHHASQVNRQAFAPIRAALTRRSDKLAERIDPGDRLDQARARLADIRKRAKSWKLSSKGFAALEKGLARTYRRAREDRAAPGTPPEQRHEWRKRIKDHWYHTRLLDRIWPQQMHARREMAHDLAELLGDEHDLVVLRDTIVRTPDLADPDTVQAFLALLDRRSLELAARAEPLADRLLAEAPEQLVDRWRLYWRAWRRGERGIIQATEAADPTPRTNHD